ncbi:MAG TPA: ABC transporter permease subunit [Smithella sp.]|jgi:phosphate transport system permease protein|nr:ABC transporter permease subunit [Smithella sp.]HOQ42598.1 ABC transporter permease subunit [Smithellaceae bacterium]HOG10651.1 ABC transporter permease subunit [Smithella sp.]HPC09318.1 ABC transporter permease subunit [Smithella sp.]HPL49018.1 ABC transporter permease subunit [Smithella sp.]
MNRFVEIGVALFAWLCAFVLLAAVGTVFVFLLIKGGAALNVQTIFGDTPVWEAITLKKAVFNGLFPAIAGTLLLVVMAVGLALPVGIAAGIYLAQYSGVRMKSIFSLFCDILAGVPSILVGLFGFSLSIFLHKYVSTEIYPCLLISAASLSFLILPYLIRTTQIALEQIPPEERLTALALGADKLQNIIYVLIPRSLSGIISGIILSIGRCAEDTAVIMLTGVVAMAGVPQSLLAKYEALPFFIYYISAQYTDMEELRMGYAAAIILVVICAVLFLAAFYIKNRLTEKALYSV